MSRDNFFPFSRTGLVQFKQSDDVKYKYISEISSPVAIMQRTLDISKMIEPHYESNIQNLTTVARYRRFSHELGKGEL